MSKSRYGELRRNYTSIPSLLPQLPDRVTQEGTAQPHERNADGGRSSTVFIPAIPRILSSSVRLYIREIISECCTTSPELLAPSGRRAIPLERLGARNVYSVCLEK